MAEETTQTPVATTSSLKPDPTMDLGDFDKLWKPEPSQPEKPQPTAQNPSQPADAKSKPIDDEIEPAPDKADKPEPTTDPKDDKNSIKGPKWYRDGLEKANREAKEAKARFAELESRLKESEPKLKESSALAQRIAAVEKERDQALAEARGLREEMSPEFKEKYEKPFAEAASDAQEVFSQLSIVNETGEPVQKADWRRDFVAIYNLPLIEARNKANAMFGEDAVTVMEMYNNLHRLDRVQQRAKVEARENWKKSEAERTANDARIREAHAAAKVEAIKGLQEKHPEFFAEDPSDPEGNELLKKGNELLKYQPKTFQEAAIWTARMEQQAAAFPRLVQKLRKAQAELEALKSKHSEEKATEPGKTQRQTGTEKESDDVGDLRSELRTMFAKGKR